MATGSGVSSDGWTTVTPPANDGWVTVQPPLRKQGQQVNKLGKAFDKYVGKPLSYAHEHPFEAFMSVAGAPQRAAQAAELGRNPLSALMDPKQTKSLEQGLREPMTGTNFYPLRAVGAGIGELERGPLQGSDLPHKLARGVLDTAYDVINDPVTYIPVGDVARIASKFVPGLPAAAKVVGKLKPALFDPERHLTGFTTYGKSLIEAVQNRARQGEWVRIQGAQAVIAKHVDEIRKGIMPPDVAALFKRPKDIPKDFTKPQDIEGPLFKGIRDETWDKIRRDLKSMGIMESKTGVKFTPKPSAGIFKDATDPQAIKAARAGLERFKGQELSGKAKNSFQWALHQLTHRGNQAFLAIPFPHMLNLINLAYNRYGVAATAKGTLNAARIATGLVGKGSQLQRDMQELMGMGANSQYANLFTEYGMNSLLGSKTLAKFANKPIVIPFERFSNWMQQKFLNPMETGLRTAALSAERKAGTKGVEAARNIHQAFGTNPSNEYTHWLKANASPFAQFHSQTIPETTVRTLANNPGRITALVHAQIDMNNQVNPGHTKFTPTTPGFSGVRALVEPQWYFASNLGPLYALGQGFSGLSDVQKGKVAEAVSKALGRYIPMPQVAETLQRLATGQKGAAGEQPSSDILPMLTGGYWSKVKP